MLAANDDDLVRRTMRALQATGDEIVALTPNWQSAVRLRAGYTQDTEVLPLRTVLTFARIRPVTREVAKRLLALSPTGSLKRIVDSRMEGPVGTLGRAQPAPLRGLRRHPPVAGRRGRAGGAVCRRARRMATESRHRDRQLSLKIVPMPRFRLPAEVVEEPVPDDPGPPGHGSRI